MKPGTRHRAHDGREAVRQGRGENRQESHQRSHGWRAWACKLVIERIIPPARDRATPFTLPPIAGPADIPQAVQAVLDAAGKGDLSIEDGERIVGLLNGLRAAYEGADLQARLDEMQARLDDLVAKAGQGSSQ